MPTLWAAGLSQVTLQTYLKASFDVASLTCFQARNHSGQVGYVPEKYLLFLDAVSKTCVVPDGSNQEGSSEREKELTDLMLEPGGASWAQCGSAICVWRLEELTPVCFLVLLMALPCGQNLPLEGAALACA